MPSLIPVLDTFTFYLLVANVTSFVVHAVHYLLPRADGRDRVSTTIRGIVSAAGGAAGTLLAFLLWDRRVVKENAWQHVLALSSAVLWGTAFCFVYLHPFDAQAFTDNLLAPRKSLGAYLLAVNLTTLATFGIDKLKAVRQGWRIPEAVLLGLCVAGGTLGGLLGMALFHHKVRSPQFAYGVPLILVSQLAVATYLISAGLL